MTEGIRALRKIQLGRETTAGTAAATTTIWRGLGTLDNPTKPIFDEEDVGILPGTDRTHIPKYEALLSMDETEATFEQLPHILEAGVRTDTPAADGSGSGKIYEYIFPTTAGPTLKTYTIQGGDNVQAEGAAYWFVEDFTLSGNGGEALKMAANWRGRQIATTSFTTTATLPTVEDILFSKGSFYVDTTGGTFGGTQKTSTLLNMNIKFMTGIKPAWTADGALYFTLLHTGKPEITGELTFEHETTSIALKADHLAETARLLRFSFSGSTLTTAGTTYSTKTLIVDLAAKIESVQKLDELDGNDVVKLNFRSRYNSTAAEFATITVVNELASLP